jgi:uncharacterized protein (DUF58 family)
VGDDLRRIHWPTTARRDELTVRQHERHQQGRTTLLLDVRAEVHTAETFERAVSATASLLVAAAERGDEVRLVTTDGTDAGYAAGHAAIDAALEYLAAVEVTDARTSSDLRVDHPGTLVVLTTPEAAPTSGALGPGRRYLVLFERSASDSAGRTSRPGGGVVRVGVDEEFAAAWVAASEAAALEPAW